MPQAADEAAAIDRPELAAAFHEIGWLPFALDDTGWKQIVLAFCDTVLVKNGMVADWLSTASPMSRAIG